MAPDTLFFCAQCGHETAKWTGRCPGCGEWNSLAERPAVKRPKAARGPLRRGTSPQSVAAAAAEQVERTSTGVEGVDRVLGGGLVPGSLVLVAGEPGVGKSTLLLQVAAAIAGDGAPAIYITGEESARQVALRAQRVGGLNPHLLLLP